MRSWLLLPTVAAGCYSPVDMAHCAITCDPLVGLCPGSLLCGTDSFCHASDEPINSCIGGVIDAPLSPDTTIIPKDGAPDSPILAVDAAPCSTEWHADFSSDPTIASAGSYWSSVGAVPFSYTSQVMFGIWNAPDMTGIATTPGYEFQSEVVLIADLELPQVDNSASFTLGLTDGTQYAQLTLAVTHPNAATDVLTLANNVPTTQQLFQTSSGFAKHRIRLDVLWVAGTASLSVDNGTAMQATFAKGAASGISPTVAINVADGAAIDDLDICVPTN